MRREWIEIPHNLKISVFPHLSPSMRREWIEMFLKRRQI